MEQREVFVGIDVSKKQLDVAFLPERKKVVTPSNDRRGIAKLVEHLRLLRPQCVAVEANAAPGAAGGRTCSRRERLNNNSRV